MQKITAFLFKLLDALADRRPADFCVFGYLNRWWVIRRNRFFNVYLHQFLGSDHSVFHDHPWVNFTLILKGRYTEHTPQGVFVRKAGYWRFRRPKSLHWIEVNEPVWTLFLTGPRMRVWGFMCGDVWVPHTVYLAAQGDDRTSYVCDEILNNEDMR